MQFLIFLTGSKSTKAIRKEDHKLLEAASTLTHDHSYKTEIDQASNLFESLEPESIIDKNNKWTFELEKGGVKVHSLATPSGLPIYRGDGLIKGFTVQEILSVIRSPNARQECKS